ncbi:MAG: hypothetical protein QOH39_2105 [Verrucomicrobiota bacterium]|jgi:hypothetical protein
MEIEIFKPFNQAIERTRQILFQPFDLKKWCVIGFAAFLANLGGGFNYNFNYNSRGTAHEHAALQNFTAWIHQISPWILIISVTLFVLLILTIVIVFAWLRARGRFMFIDCVVKNRGAIKEPWREFRGEGNSFFLFSLIVGLCLFAVIAALALPFLLPIARGVTFLHLHDTYLIAMIVLWATAIFLLVISWTLIAHFMIPVMYRRRCRAVEAFRVVCSLIANYPGEITLYCLFWIGLVIGSALVACLSTCATCCLTLIPYVGTVIVLPLFVCLRSFGLLFLRQFGSDYDVWATLLPAEDPLASPEAPLPPPLPA